MVKVSKVKGWTGQIDQERTYRTLPTGPVYFPGEMDQALSSHRQSGGRWLMRANNGILASSEAVRVLCQPHQEK